MIKTQALYYRELKADDICPKCGRVLITVAVDSEVFMVCLRCSHRNLVTRVSNKRKVDRDGM